MTENVTNLKTYKLGDDWEVFSERLDQFLLANKIEDARKASVLLTLISEDVYKILRNNCDPDKPSTKSYEELVNLLTVQFKPNISIYRRRIQFDRLKQREESVNGWYIRVLKAAGDCDFGPLFEARVLDKFVVGMRPGPIINQLCEESPNRPLKEMVELALIKEATLKETRREAQVVLMRRRWPVPGFLRQSRREEK